MRFCWTSATRRGTSPRACERKGIKGVRNTARFLNPIVRYARGRLNGEAASLDLMKGDVLSVMQHDGSKQDVPLPAPVKRFLDAFNAGKYPDLELPLDQG